MKAATFSQFYVQLVFAVKFRKALIHPEWEEELFKFITGVVSKRGQKLYAINGWTDHIHILVSMEANCYVPDLVRNVKRSSTEFIQKQGFTSKNFRWQNGYGAFTHDRRTLPRVIDYIDRQKEHHRQKEFLKEYQDILDHYQISRNEKYIFHPPE